jgi:hypothetical protein
MTNPRSRRENDDVAAYRRQVAGKTGGDGFAACGG